MAGTSDTSAKAAAPDTETETRGQPPATSAVAVTTHAKGTKVWIPEEVEGWREATVIKVNNESNTVVVEFLDESTRKLVEKEVSVDDAPLQNELGGTGVEDMTKLSYLHEPGVLANLRGRFQLDEIYTFTGSILIAVNPFRRLPHLYDMHMMEQYRGMELGELSPHVFAIADVSFRAMMKDEMSQSILVSGESGAGKTETTKYLMSYLAHVGGRVSSSRGGATNGTAPTATKSVEQQVLESNPLLEAFGNAKTVRNDNSSRFGKFVEIQFDTSGRISGAAIRTYLLERSRVVSLTDPERNYHIFYQLCDGPDAEKYGLGPPSNYHYLNQSSCFELKSFSNADAYEQTRNAMDVVGLSGADQDAVFSTVASVLHLGNIAFEAIDDESCKVAAGAEDALTAAAGHFGVPVEGLRKALTTRIIKTFDGAIEKPLSVARAIDSRDSLAKTVYARLFDWLVSRVNVSIGQDESSKYFIGVLDIYGFESFKKNSFEQFCINLANEKLQQHFNQHVFKMEQEEYEKEAIDWSYIEFVDNQDALDLIEARKDGILSVLDEACMLANTTPADFVSKLVSMHKNNKRLSKPKRSQVEFTMDHYAGMVTYETDAFIDKNKDYVNADHQALLEASERDLVKALFPIEADDAAGGRPGGKSKSSNKFVSVGTRFKGQLGELMKTLSFTEPHYIRCVKPNAASVPSEFEAMSALQQLRCGGVLEAIRISCAGYPARKYFDEFINRFGVLVPGESPDGKDADRRITQAILNVASLEGYQMGKTKVFLRAGQMAVLDKMRTETLNAAATAIQKHLRRYVVQKKYVETRKATVVIQSGLRGMKARKRAKNIRENRAALKLQTKWRASYQRKQYLEIRQATITMQSAYRSKVAQNKLLALKYEKSARVIQNSWRVHVARRELVMARRSAVKIQTAWRGKLARKELRRLKIEAREVGGLVKAKNELSQKVEALNVQVELARKAKETAQKEHEVDRAKMEDMQTSIAALESAAAKAAEETVSREQRILDEAAAREKAEAATAAALAQVAELEAKANAGPSEEELAAQKAAAEANDAAAAEAAERIKAVETENAELKKILDSMQRENERFMNKIQELEQERVVLQEQVRDARSRGAMFASGVVAGSRRGSLGLANSGQSDGSAKDMMLSSAESKRDNAGDHKALLICLKDEIGFSNGRPLAACLIFRCLLEWRCFEQEKTNIFEQIITTVTESTDPHMENNEVLSYWLSNAATLQSLLQKTLRTSGTAAPQGRRRSSAIFLRWNNGFRSGPAGVSPSNSASSPAGDGKDAGDSGGSNAQSKGSLRQVDAKYPALLFKQQLTAFVEKIFTQIRDNVKKEITPLLGSCIQAPRANRSGNAGSNGTSDRRSRSASNHAKVAGVPWKQILQVQQTLLEAMRANFIPSFLSRKLFSQVFSFINVQLFNSLLLRRECCSFSNGEYVKTGLTEIENWIEAAGSEWVGNAWEELRYIRQAVTFLVIHQKARKSLNEIINDVCPVLSVQQLYRISTMYWDDKYGTETVSSDVLQQMRKLMMEDSTASLSNSFLLDDDSSIPFAMEEIASAMPEVDIRETPLPPALKGNDSFTFLALPPTATA